MIKIFIAPLFRLFFLKKITEGFALPHGHMGGGLVIFDDLNINSNFVALPFTVLLNNRFRVVHAFAKGRSLLESL
jgi:hypothetical protein